MKRDPNGPGRLSEDECVQEAASRFKDAKAIHEAMEAAHAARLASVKEIEARLNSDKELSAQVAARPTEALAALGLLRRHDRLRLDYGSGAARHALDHLRLTDLKIEPFFYLCVACRWELDIECTQWEWPPWPPRVHEDLWPRPLCILTVRLVCTFEPKVPCVTVCVKTIAGADDSRMEQDFEKAQEIYQQCGIRLVLGETETNDRPDLLDIDRDNCVGPPNHSVSDDEDDLYDLLRGDCPGIVAYYVRSDDGLLGCAAHPEDRPGFTVTDGQPDRLTFAHELGHVLGLPHVNDPGNIMDPSNIGEDFTEEQCETMLESPFVRRCCP